MRIHVVVLICIGMLILSSPASAQDADSLLQDSFLGDLTGRWTMTGHVMGDSVTYDAHGTWVLNHQFLCLRMEDVNTPPEYVAHVYIGYDPTAQEYVTHWLDDSGGRSSKTLGYGDRESEALEFTFDYPDGPFRTRFERTADGYWHVRMRTKDDGTWGTFAEYEMVPRGTSR